MKTLVSLDSANGTEVPTPLVCIVKKDVKHINLKVKPSGEVILTVPIDSDERDIAYVLKKRADWIEKKKAFFNAHRDLCQKEYYSINFLIFCF